jgi:ribonucleoside-triphosphate reductase
MFLDKAGIAYDKLIVGEENKDLVALYGIKQAPTLVVISGDSFETIPNLSNIKAYAEKK